MAKTCKKCKIEKPLTAFAARAASKDGLRYTCKQCDSEYHKQRYAHNVNGHRDKVMKRTRERDIYKQFKLTVEEYDKYMEEGKCAICEATDRLVLDHCHNSGKIRGVLCHNCNVGIGNLRDSPELVARALYYLQGEWQYGN